MKPLLLLFMVILVSACDVYVAEPRYDDRDRYTGRYSVEEYSNTYHDYTYYSFRISKLHHSRNEIVINNFYGANIDVYGFVYGNEVTIPLQVVQGYEIDGVGSLYGGKLALSYRVRDLYDGSTADFCETIAWRD